MAITDNYAPTKTSGNGVTVDFSGNWNVIAQSYIRVYWEDKTTGVQTLKTLGSDYTLVFNESGFTVTFDAGSVPPSTVWVIVSRDVSEDQTSPYETSKGFQGKAIEDSFDKLTAIDQDQSDEIARSFKLPLATTGVDTTLPLPVANKALLWNSTADALENSIDDFNDIVTDATAQADAAAASASASASSASSSASSASASASSASAASTSETNAATSESNAATSETNAATSEANAATSESNAADSEALSEEWATKVDGIVDSTEYSSKAYAIGGTGVTDTAGKGAAKEWATKAEDSTVDGSEYSAKHYATKAQVAKIEWKGTYNAGTAYELNDAVTYLGSSFICIQAGTGQTPAVGGTAYWDDLANKGDTGPSVDVQDLLDNISTTQGEILYRNASDWVSLPVGTDGQVLTTKGAAANPQWAEAGGGGAWKLLSTFSGNNVTEVEVIDLDTLRVGYSSIKFILQYGSTGLTNIKLALSNDNGSSYKASGYNFVYHHWSTQSTTITPVSEQVSPGLINLFFGNQRDGTLELQWDVYVGTNFKNAMKWEYFDEYRRAMGVCPGGTFAFPNAIKFVSDDNLEDVQLLIYGRP